MGGGDLLFEYGKYPEEEEEERSEQTKPEKKNKKLTRMDKKIAKPGKQKKKKPSNPVKKRLLLGSHLLGFNEGYGVPLDCKASGSSDNSKLWDVRKQENPLTPHITKTSKEWDAVVRVLMHPTRFQDEDSKLDVYIDYSDVYSIGVGFRDLLFEYGKYLEEEEEERSEQTKPEKKNKKLTRMDKKIAKPGKQKKKKPSNPVKNRLLLGSHLLGFNEGY
nr:hypothetical protein [Tanacetum cinerariifolium]